MKVYFTASITGKKYYLENYKEIIKSLKRLGHTVLSEHVISGPEKFNLLSKKERMKFHEKLNNLISRCDLFIAEVSFPSLSVAYEISLALKKDKPTLILYLETNEEQELPGILEGMESERLLISQYRPAELPDLLGYSVNFLKQKVDQRFTFFITPKISHYLDEITKRRKTPRSVYLRRLIEKDMEKA